ncbi:Cytochrome c oxidase (B(O/a)3-type) chain I [Thioalkalivibrio nitratireducens DSM 14787]|uniref:Cytochrome c oxidase (B(O/a)3-type) chain I n=1 Tax=Thioalkalivibrio nitratireducens (strain DSM 14787 / UNIQEM 213 / ALEN2) TaxID=1255043 RepID=L0DXW3_THIND|nr:cbb3-type cytochrome c oxidase subunit I [Thioalkalivibrio nitratireducens]AGA33221.1 Cytochrome c oxidase (B(O/a)3-type) chain I [Thioalkalivibrio nitratireducens DSM 14787]
MSIFFYWLLIAQAALLLGFAAAEQGRGLIGRRLAWLSFALILAGFGACMAGAHIGVPLLYDGAPGLGALTPSGLLVFNLGYLLLGTGLMVLPAAAIVTLLTPRWEGRQDRLSAVGFALFAWAGSLIVSGFAALYTFLPGTRWALGLGVFPENHGTNWHIVFHNMHYLPLMATVILWYVLVQALTGVKSVFGHRFSKIVFAMYLVFVPPTSLYHMFLEPDLPGAVRVTGSLLSLFVSVPTLTAFLIIIASLEMYARGQGGRGLFGWLRLLPWRHPAMSALGVGVLSMGLGIVFAFVLIQERLAPLLSDTFFVPGYFHFFTVGTVTLTLLAALTVMLPALGERPLWRPGLLRWMPWLVFAGLLVFGADGAVAGYLGVPRRVIDVAYQSEAPMLWQGLMLVIAVGGAVMASALAVFAAGVGASLWRAGASAPAAAGLTVNWAGGPAAPGAAAWIGPLSVLVIVAAMYLFTAIGFELMPRIWCMSWSP